MNQDYEDFKAKVRSAADIVDVIGSYVPLKKRGNKHWACCPFHGEKTPSFRFDQLKQMFYCFGCHVGGDVFNFVMRQENCTFPEAIKILADKYNISLPEREKSPQDLERERNFQSVANANSWAAKYFAACLQHTTVGAVGRDYLRNRGITEEIIRVFQIGFAQNSFDSLQKALLTKRVSLSDQVRAGLILERNSGGYFDKFRNRIMIPIKDPKGNIVGFGGRILGDGEPKYLNTGETAFFNKRYLLFGYDIAKPVIRERRQAVMVEGYMDAISLHSAGFGNVVASMGTAFSVEQAKLLQRNAVELILCYDSDRAGREASLRAVSIARQNGLAVRVACVPGAKDPDEFVRAQGPGAFQKVIDEAKPGLEFQVDYTLEHGDLRTLAGKVAVIKKVLPYLKECGSEIEIAAEIRKLAERLTVDEGLIKDEFRRLSRDKKYALVQANNVTEQSLSGPEDSTERLLLALLIKDSSLLDNQNQELSDLEFHNDLYRKIFQLLHKYRNRGRSFETVSEELSPEENSVFGSLCMQEFSDNHVRLLQDCLRSLQNMRLQEAYNEHVKLAEAYEKNGDARVLDELKKCQEIRNEINKLYQ